MQFTAVLLQLAGGPRRPDGFGRPDFRTMLRWRLLRAGDSMRQLRRFKLLFVVALSSALFFSSYTLSAMTKYPDEPVNLYQWRKMRKQQTLPEELLRMEDELAKRRSTQPLDILGI